MMKIKYINNNNNNNNNNNYNKHMEPNCMPFCVFRWGHLRSTSVIICCSGSFAAQFGIISGLRIVCGRGSFTALYRLQSGI